MDHYAKQEKVLIIDTGTNEHNVAIPIQFYHAQEIS